ncbi:MAG: hypothetical protein IJG51_01380 [Synergistaceae bacterium]|nr:hypothetical protein [Synergistaceae bacterium]MBQ3397518.1 hypothetical protein [Synergistaceae bacterium]MBQ6115352.1 hypothetical protein [Synergistaceae bacterium]MBR0185701.1 hypothetical protein [Synergistaceae bacterium]MBR0247401.1 hypothetical protein [Synergistaceae bacterium]
MNFRRNRASTSSRILLLATIFTAGIFFTPSYCAELTPSEKTIQILERWTSAHWGQDCFVWVVHYPEELAGTWAEAEAIRSGMSEVEQERFRENFVSELKLDTSETFLVSVYSFGARPMNLYPVKDNVSLLAASGERIKPTKYDSALDNPSAGIVQGLVFFPKQSNKDYVIGLRGMGRGERIFSFAPPETPPPAEPKKPDVVVVNVPKRQPKKPVPIPVKKPTPPSPPPIPPRPIKPIFQQESSDMADFVRTVRERGNETSRDSTPPQPAPRRQANSDNAYSSRETVLRRFLNLWADGSYGEMYDMLSEGSRKVISRENFMKEAGKASDIRAGIKGGDYKVDWVGEERAKVITTRKTLVFRSVSSRTLGVTREGSSWKIVW